MSFYILMKVFETAGTSEIQAPMTLTAWYAYFNLVIKAISLILRIIVHVYLIKMVLRMQALLRQYNHVKGYSGERLVFIMYIIFCGNLVYWYMFKPVLRLYINTTPYECTDGVKKLMVVLNIWQHIAGYLPAQVVFFALIWQMCRIQQEAMDRMFL